MQWQKNTEIVGEKGIK